MSRSIKKVKNVMTVKIAARVAAAGHHLAALTIVHFCSSVSVRMAAARLAALLQTGRFHASSSSGGVDRDAVQISEAGTQPDFAYYSRTDDLLHQVAPIRV